MNDKKSRYAINYVLRFTAFSLLSALLTLMLVLLALRLGKSSSATAINPSEAQETTPLTVVIDAGHGGEDGGASGISGALEKDLNLDIARLIADMLRANGVSVVMTRTEDILLYDPTSDYKGRKKALDLAARLKIARETEGAIFVSIHMNAFPQSQYSGLQVYYSKNHAESRAIAELIQSKVRTCLQADNTRRIKAANSSIFLLDRLETPAVLIECGFLSNPKECMALSNAEYRHELAFVIFCALMNYISNNCS